MSNNNPLQHPTHTVIELDIPGDRVGEMVRQDLVTVMTEISESEDVTRLGLQFDPKAKANEWADHAIDRMQTHWTDRLIRELDIILEDDYENPYDYDGTYNPKPAAEVIRSLMQEGRHDLAVSELMRVCDIMGMAWPIDFRDHEWSDIRVVPISTTVN